MSPLLRKDGKLLRADSGALANSLCPPPCCEGGSCYANATATSRLVIDILSATLRTKNTSGGGTDHTATVSARVGVNLVPVSGDCARASASGSFSVESMSGSIVGVFNGTPSGPHPLTSVLIGPPSAQYMCFCGNPAHADVYLRSPRHILNWGTSISSNIQFRFSASPLGAGGVTALHPTAYDALNDIIGFNTNPVTPWAFSSGSLVRTLLSKSFSRGPDTHLDFHTRYVEGNVSSGPYTDHEVVGKISVLNMVRCGDPGGLGTNLNNIACPNGVLP